MENVKTKKTLGGGKTPNLKMEKKPGSGRTTSEILLNYALYIIIGLMIVAIIIIKPSFLSLNSLTNILDNSATRAIIACGAAGLLVLQGTDLSAGRILGLCAAVSASLVQAADYTAKMYPNIGELPLVVPVLISMFIGLIFGTINGFGVAILKLHAFIITLGTQLIAYGLTQVYIAQEPNNGQPIGNFSEAYRNVISSHVMIGKFRLNYYVIFAVLICVVMWFIWNKTKLGKNMFAVGGNYEAAAVSGVNNVKVIMIIFMISGALYGLAAFLEAGRAGSVNPQTGINYDLDAISACVIGGVSFSGGVGTIPGAVLGVVLLSVINYGLVFISVPSYYQYIIKGLIIILAVSIDVRKYLVKK